MPEFKEGETRNEWMARCVPIRHGEHPSEDNKQSVAVCFSMWTEHEKKKNSKSSKDKKKKDEDKHA
jgi:hypothetical protein